MKKNTNFPAFPSEVKETKGDTVYTGFNEGMTLRDYFAAKAMQSLIDGPRMCADLTRGFEDRIANVAYNVADAMLKQREL